ncbi:YlxR family protein [Actinotalea sp. K2]|uniref:YlxR family protein n=1 Tax=Actinotalea sp. K2 TaxID=2939438 RepID=UPI002018207D|nr:YlxR family protein [Actinotalea sp. K2]MCL3860203.1 YlxR family protein [Actinotalea sp. K2]
MGPVRTCVGCRSRDQRSVLLRVVLSTSDESTIRAVVDEGHVMPGRGAWLHPEPRCLELAERRRALPRALRVTELDTSPVTRWFEHESRIVTDGLAARPSFIEKESGLEADGHPMSTQR